MAVQPRELQISQPREAPRLALVPAPPRRHPVAAALFVILLLAVLSVPVVGAALEPAPEAPAYRPRAVPAAEITHLDRLGPDVGGNIPSSGEPVAGVAFVRCTRLWVGDPDGSNERRLFDMTGISAPAFSPDGRTIAFVRTQGGRQSLWFAAADGSTVRRAGAFRSGGGPVPTRVSGLAWAPGGNEIAFALTDGTHGPLEGGSAMWTLDLVSGSFHRIGGGWPAPVWFGDRLLFGGLADAPDIQLTGTAGRRIEDELNSGYDDLAAAVVPQGWWSNGRNGVAVLRSNDGELELAIRNLWGRKDRSVAGPPPGYRFARFTQPVITQDASRVAIDLLDPGAGRDLGLLDPATGEWTVLDYAWDPSTSPTPTLLGPLTARVARSATEMLLSNWGRRPGRAQMMTAGDVPLSLLPWKHIGWAVRAPVRTAEGWLVPSIAYSFGFTKEPYGYRELDVLVRRDRGRLTATPTDLGPLTSVTTLEEAHTFAEAVMGRELPDLPPLPSGTALVADYGLNASTWNGTTATINAVAPSPDGTGRGTDMSFSYGDRIDFSLGCGGPVDPQPTDVAGAPAMIDHSGSIRQVIWPATPEEPTGTFSVHGTLSKEELLGLAEGMAVP